jgi:hypothetical protein
MMQGDSQASYTDFAVDPYTISRFLHASYGRIIAVHPTSSDSIIPINDVFDYYPDEERYLGPIYVENNNKALYLNKFYDNYSLIPEYTHNSVIDSLINQTASNLSDDLNKLNISGTISYDSLTTENDKIDFYENYVNSDTLSCVDDIQESGKLKNIKINFDCVTNFTPYEGFYPVQRIMQLNRLFYNNYNSLIQTTGSDLNIFPIVKPLFGVLMNSIRSCVAVDYPYLTSHNLPTTSVPNIYGGPNISQLNKSTWTASFECTYKDRLPLRAIWEPYKWFGGKIYLDYDIELGDYNTTCSVVGSSPLYDKAAENFVAESANFFLEDTKMTYLASKPEEQWRFDLSDLDAGLTSRTTKKFSMEVAVQKRNFCNHDSVSFYGHAPYIYHIPFYSTTNWEDVSSGSKEQDLSISPRLYFTASHTDNTAYARVEFDIDKLSWIDPIRYSQILSTGKISLQDIQSFSTVEYVNESINNFFTSSITSNMTLDAGINLFDKNARNEWVINSKHEWPSLDFRHVEANSCITTDPASENTIWNNNERIVAPAIFLWF